MSQLVANLANSTNGSGPISFEFDSSTIIQIAPTWVYYGWPIVINFMFSAPIAAFVIYVVLTDKSFDKGLHFIVLTITFSYSIVQLIIISKAFYGLFALATGWRNINFYLCNYYDRFSNQTSILTYYGVLFVALDRAVTIVLRKDIHRFFIFLVVFAFWSPHGYWSMGSFLSRDVIDGDFCTKTLYYTGGGTFLKVCNLLKSNFQLLPCWILMIQFISIFLHLAIYVSYKRQLKQLGTVRQSKEDEGRVLKSLLLQSLTPFTVALPDNIALAFSYTGNAKLLPSWWFYGAKYLGFSAMWSMPLIFVCMVRPFQTAARRILFGEGRHRTILGRVVGVSTVSELKTISKAPVSATVSYA